MQNLRLPSLVLCLALAPALGCQSKSETANTPAPETNKTAAAASKPADKPAEKMVELTVTMAPKSDSKVSGTVRLMAVEGGVKVIADLKGVPEGSHGFHVHEKGDCSAADGTSAGGHFDPDGHEHGMPGTDMHHLGDLGNIEADAEGNATKEHIAKGANLKAGDAHSFAGLAIILHAKSDDGGQPTGNAGSRIACGVIPPPAS